MAAADQPGTRPSTARTNLSGALLAMLGRLNIASKESVVRQYDHEVQGDSVIKPLVGRHGVGPIGRRGHPPGP